LTDATHQAPPRGDGTDAALSRLTIRPMPAASSYHVNTSRTVCASPASIA